MNCGKFAIRFVCSSPIEPELSITNRTSIFSHRAAGGPSVPGSVLASTVPPPSSSSPPRCVGPHAAAARIKMQIANRVRTMSSSSSAGTLDQGLRRAQTRTGAEPGSASSVGRSDRSCLGRSRATRPQCMNAGGPLIAILITTYP